MTGSRRFAGQEPMRVLPDMHLEFEVKPKPDDIRVLKDGIYALNVQTAELWPWMPWIMLARPAWSAHPPGQ